MLHFVVFYYKEVRKISRKVLYSGMEVLTMHNMISLTREERRAAYKATLDNLTTNNGNQTLWLALEDWLNKIKGFETTWYQQLYILFPELLIQKPDVPFNAKNWVWWKDDTEMANALEACIGLTS